MANQRVQATLDSAPGPRRWTHIRSAWYDCEDRMKYLSILAALMICGSMNQFTTLSAEEATRITSHEAGDYHTRWSPDSREILFASDRDGDFDIWKVPVGGGEPICVWDGPGLDDRPVYSSDGTELIFTAQNSTEPCLWLLSLKSGTSIPLVRGSGISWPCWSPDGTMIGYVSRETGNSDIWVIKVPERGAALSSG